MPIAGIAFLVVCVVLPLAGAALQIWNSAYRRGTTGQTFGQKMVKIKTVSEETGQPSGFGNAFLRDLCHVVDSMVCYVGYLMPLWDGKRQTLADKIVRTVVVRVNGRADPSSPVVRSSLGSPVARIRPVTAPGLAA